MPGRNLGVKRDILSYTDTIYEGGIRVTLTEDATDGKRGYTTKQIHKDILE